MSTFPIMQTGREVRGGPHTPAWITPATDFGAMLRGIRERTKLSQSALAEGADFDHSHVSRLECGARMPTRDAVDRIATALGCAERERRELLAAAGFHAGRGEGDRLLDELGAILADPDLPAWKRAGMRGCLLVALNLSRLDDIDPDASDRGVDAGVDPSRAREATSPLGTIETEGLA